MKFNYDSSVLPPTNYNVRYIKNPSQDDLKALTQIHEVGVFLTAHGNLNKLTRNKARMANYTYIIAPDNEVDRYSHKIMNPGKAENLISRQKSYIESKGELIQIDGYYGVGEYAFPIQWLFTSEGANIAGMQDVLAFSRKDVESETQLKEDFKPVMRVIFTPDCYLNDMEGRQAIIVDLRNMHTYVMGADYFGESKKGALRMLCDYVYQKNGLVMHAGAKAVYKGDKKSTMLIMGLSGTGKTTTTFSKQGDKTHPIQDDMVCLWTDGTCSVTENGCFAKTAGLTEEQEPVIFRGTIHPTAWVENVFVNLVGQYDFHKDRLTPLEVKRYRQALKDTGADSQNVEDYISGTVKFKDVVDDNDVPKDGWDFVVWTQNGRSIIPMEAIEDAADLKNIPKVDSIGMLNRDEGHDAATPGIIRFGNPLRSAGYFMLGETSKTSAAGKDRGKTRSPFTQPFFPRSHELQAKRFIELQENIPNLDLWLMNTGYIGGTQRDVESNKAMKVKIKHSSAMLEALIDGKIVWKIDPDFGYQIVDVDAPENADLVAVVPKEILNPILFYQKENRMNEYNAWVKNIKAERKAFLEKYNVSKEIIASVLNEEI